MKALCNKLRKKYGKPEAQYCRVCGSILKYHCDTPTGQQLVCSVADTNWAHIAKSLTFTESRPDRNVIQLVEWCEREQQQQQLFTKD